MGALAGSNVMTRWKRVGQRHADPHQRAVDGVEHGGLERGRPALACWWGRIRLRIRLRIDAAMLPKRHRLPKVRACIGHWARWMRGKTTTRVQA